MFHMHLAFPYHPSLYGSSRVFLLQYYDAESQKITRLHGTALQAAIVPGFWLSGSECSDSSTWRFPSASMALLISAIRF